MLLKPVYVSQKLLGRLTKGVRTLLCGVSCGLIKLNLSRHCVVEAVGHCKHLNYHILQQKSTFTVAIFTVHLEAESVSIKSLFQRKNRNEAWFPPFQPTSDDHDARFSKYFFDFENNIFRDNLEMAISVVSQIRSQIELQNRNV